MTGAPFWCLSDSSAIRSALVDLDRQMMLRLFHHDGYGSIDLNERVSSSPEPASPSDAHDQLDELVRWLRSWQVSYWKICGWSHTAYVGESAPALTEVTSALCAHLDGILSHTEYAVDFGSGVLSWHSEVTAAAQTRPRRISMQMRCPQCHLATLPRLEGEDRIECRNRDCGANRGGPVVMTADEYHGLAEAVIVASGRRR
ncbi:hypothetical protein [Nonomuraea sp. NPDC050786]|uniref:hypothetical protein n=1 Tax=Nonomuraea sp. NPDC050786 TaxID=3154840 RepID=UPI0033D6B616